MNRDEALVIVRELMAMHVGTEPDAIQPDMHVVDDLGLDSVDAVELLITLERQTGLRFEVDQLDDIATVADVVTQLVAASVSARPVGGRE